MEFANGASEKHPRTPIEFLHLHIIGTNSIVCSFIYDPTEEPVALHVNTSLYLHTPNSSLFELLHHLFHRHPFHPFMLVNIFDNSLVH